MTGRKAIRVMIDWTKLEPRSSMICENRIVSSWTRCEAPSIWRSLPQFAM